MVSAYADSEAGLSGFGLFVFHEDINLISFSLANVLISHGYFDFVALKLWILKHP